MPEQHRVMIVDDDQAICRSLARILRTHGYEVETAFDGLSAVERADSFQPHLLILDIRMPGIDGVETFHQIRERHPAVTGVLMTAHSGQSVIQDATDRGVLTVMSKPLDVNVLSETVSEALRTAPVLIVDDDEQLLASLKRALAQRGIETKGVTTLAEAMRELRRRPDRVVIADVVLGDGFGYELLCEVSRSGNVQPFVLMSGKADWRELANPELIASRATWMSKPLDMETLLGHLGQTTADSGGRTEGDE